MCLNRRCISVLLLIVPLIAISLWHLCQSDCYPNPFCLAALLIVFCHASFWWHKFGHPMLHLASTSLISKAASPLLRSHQTGQPQPNSNLSFPTLSIIQHSIFWQPKEKITEKALLVSWPVHAWFTQAMIALWKFNMFMTINIVKEYSCQSLASCSHVIWAEILKCYTLWNLDNGSYNIKEHLLYTW